MRPEIEFRFRFHPATTDARRAAHETVRHALMDVADLLDARIPEGREKALALTKLEEAMFWGNAAIARQPAE